MAKLRITKEQAIMLENLNKPKVLKITESQYNEILKHEGIGEGAVIPQIANAFRGKDKQNYIQNVNSETKVKGVFNESEGLWKEFVNELYGLNESGNNLYEKLIKLMEACGYVENRKLSKTKFDGDKDKAKNVILGGLHKLHECGSPYMAMEEMENEYERITNSLKNQLTQEPTNNFSDEEKNDEIQRRREIELQRRKESGETTLKEDDVNQESVVGIDILNYEPFKSLPDERGEESTNRVTLPSLDTADARVSMRSKTDFIDHEVKGPYKIHKMAGYITMFKSKFGEEPVFTNIQTNGSYIGANISNESFLEWQNRGIENKRNWLDSERNQGVTDGLDEMEVDETTSMGGSGAVFGNQGGDFPVGKLEFTEDKIYEALDTLKKKVEEETEETIEEQGIGSVGAYDTPGFAASEFMGTAGKKGKAPVNKGVTHKNTMIPGGSFVEESAFDKTQWVGGAFVEIDDCTKLNNNKEAQNGGCSTGSIDGVVKLKKTANNVNAPSKKQGE